MTRSTWWFLGLDRDHRQRLHSAWIPPTSTRPWLVKVHDDRASIGDAHFDPTSPKIAARRLMMPESTPLRPVWPASGAGFTVRSSLADWPARSSWSAGGPRGAGCTPGRSAKISLASRGGANQRGFTVDDAMRVMANGEPVAHLWPWAM